MNFKFPEVGGACPACQDIFYSAGDASSSIPEASRRAKAGQALRYNSLRNCPLTLAPAQAGHFGFLLRSFTRAFPLKRTGFHRQK